MKPNNTGFVKIAHLSDFHFGFFGGVTKEKMNACKESLIKFNPNVVLVTGDLGLLGGGWEFFKAKRFLDSLPFEKIIVPGNHDVLDGFLLPKINPWKRLRSFYRYFPFKSDIIIGNLQIVGVDSTAPYAIGRGHVKIEEFKKFSKKKNVIKCLALHHHIIAVPGTGEFNIIRNVDEVVGEIIKHNIQYVFHGHRHKRMHFRLDSFIWDKKLDNPIDIFACGTTLSKRMRGNDPYNNYNQVIINTKARYNCFSYVNMVFDRSRKEFIPRDRGFKTKEIKSFEKDGFLK